MTPRRFLSGEPPVTVRPRFSHGSTAKSLWTIEQRLASAERELCIQFTRIAQLQAELDLMLAALRHATDAHAIGLRVESFRVNTGVGPRPVATPRRLV
jgi:hypothetical protein